MKSRILLAEDEKDINDLLCEHLTTQGYEVSTCFDGKSTLDKIEKFGPEIDLFLLDWMMPGKSGIELCQYIRSQSSTQDKPIIILTARSDSDSVITGLDSGANDYISKPFDLRELSARIRSQLRSLSTGSHASKLEYEGLVIDTDSYTVTVNNSLQKFTKSEFILLQTLLSKIDTVYTRKDLIIKIQGDQTFVTDRTIDTHMASIRKKIGAYANQIKTIRGIGYKFES